MKRLHLLPVAKFVRLRITQVRIFHCRRRFWRCAFPPSSLLGHISYLKSQSASTYPAVIHAIKRTPMSVGGAGTGILKQRHAAPIAKARSIANAVFIRVILDSGTSCLSTRAIQFFSLSLARNRQAEPHLNVESLFP